MSSIAFLLGVIGLQDVPKRFSLGSRGSIISHNLSVKTPSGFAIRLKGKMLQIKVLKHALNG